MSLRVVDPAGSEWTVSREWLGMPGWARRERGSPFADPPVITTIGDDVSGYGGLALVLIAIVAVIALLWLLLPLFVFVVAAIVASAAFLLRLVGLSAWTVRACRGDSILAWRVRGLGRSRRAMDQIVARLAAGEQPTVDGVAGELDRRALSAQ